MHAMMLLAGPGISEAYDRKLVARIIDVAPTLSKMLGIPVPKDAEGAVLYDVLEQVKK